MYVILNVSKERGKKNMNKIKKIITWIRDFAIIMLILVILPGIVGNIENHYTREAQVIAIKGQTVVVVDKTDKVWEFEGEGFIEGDVVKMKMFTNCTNSNVYDDEIIKVKIINK